MKNAKMIKNIVVVLGVLAGCFSGVAGAEPIIPIIIIKGNGTVEIGNQ